jgi:TPR repeat protein
MGAVCLPVSIVLVAIIGAVPASGSRLEAVARKYTARGNHDKAMACWERLRAGSDPGTALHNHAQRALAKDYALGFGGILRQTQILMAVKDSGYPSEAESLDALGSACSSADADPWGMIDYAAGAKYFEKAAVLGNGHAMFALALCYNDGRGVKKDVDVARGWLVKAVHAESPDAMGYLGNALAHESDPEDQADGVTWLTKAAMKGNIAAMRDLARCYRFGKGVAANRTEADRWEREAELRASGKPFW